MTGAGFQPSGSEPPCLRSRSRPLPSFPRKRESMGLILRCASCFFLFSWVVSLPCGERVPSFASPKEGTKKRRPGGDGPSGYPAMLAPMGRDLNSALRASDLGPGLLPLPLRFSASPTGVKFKNEMNAAGCRLAFDFGPLRRRRGAQAKREVSGPYV